MATKYDNIINTLELSAGLPESSSRYSAADILDMINKSLQQNIIPQLAQLNEEYLLTKQVIPLTTNGVQNYPTGFIPISPRSYGQTIRALSFQREGDSKALVSIPYVDLRDTQNFDRENTTITTGAPTGYHFFSNGIKLLGDTAKLNGTIHMYFILEPSELVSTDLVTPITTLTWTGTQLKATLPTASIPATTAAYIANGQTKLLDITHTPSGAIQLWDKRATRTDVGANSEFLFTVNPEITADRVVELATMVGVTGSDLAILPARQTSITNMPKEYDNLLILDVAKRIWASLGDTDKASQFAQLYGETRDRLTSAMGNRSKGEPKVISNRNGILRNLKGTLYGRRW